MNLLGYISSDRKSSIYWIAIFIFSLFISLCALLITTQSADTAYSIYLYIPGVIVIIYFGFYLNGYLTYKQQQRFKNYVESELKLGKFISEEMYIGYNTFTMKALSKQGYDATINIGERTITFEILELDDTLILLGSVNALGTFKHHIKPIVITTSRSYMFQDIQVYLPEKVEKIEGEGEETILFKKSIEGIKYLKRKKENNCSQ